MKIIIDLPEWYIKETKEFKHPNFVDKAIAEGRRLDDLKGEWIEFKNEYKCSKCGHIMDKVLTVSGNWIYQYSNYCPNCGADMREVSE